MDDGTAPNDFNGTSDKGATKQTGCSASLDGEDTRKERRLAFGDDDATVATAQHSLSEGASNERLAEWALAKISSIDPTHAVLRNRPSRSSLFSDDDDDADDEDNHDASSSVASFSSFKGLENISVASDVILPSRYSFPSRLRDDCHQRMAHSSSEEYEANEPEKFTAEHLDVTSDTSASSVPSSSQSDPSDDEEEEGDDADSDMTLGEAASQMADCTNASDDEDDLVSKASSSKFTPDEFWDWLDNVQVAFIEVNKSELSRKPKTRVPSSASPKDLVDGSSERVEELSFSDPLLLARDCGYLNEECHDDGEQCRSAPAYERNEGSVHSAQKHVPLLKHSASVADFRSQAEQVEHVNQDVPSSLRRTVSFADMPTEQSTVSSETFDDCDTRMRRISSNEHLLLTLHRSTMPSRAAESSLSLGAHASLVTSRAQQIECSLSGALVCYEPSWKRVSRRLVPVLSLLCILFTASKLSTLFYEEIPGTCKPRTLTIDLDSTYIPSYEEVSVAFETSTSAVVDVLMDKLPESLDDVNAILAETKLSAVELYNYLKDHLPSSPEIVKPRIVAIDFEKYASMAYQDAGEFVKSSRDALGDHQWTESIDRLQSTLVQARVVLMQHLSELCRSSTIDGPKEAVFGACDALYEKLSNSYATAEIQADLGPPQMIFDRAFVQRSFDLMANETLAYIVRFATVIHDRCTDLRSHCHSVPMSEGNSVEVLNEARMPNPPLQSEASCFEAFLPVVPHLATAVKPDTSHDSGGVCEQSTEQDVPEDVRTESAPLSPKNDSNNVGDTNEGGGMFALSPRVHEILSHLDAKDRLGELESLLVEKFGPDFVDPPPPLLVKAGNNAGWMPMLGRERDRQLHELWLKSVESLVVESTRQGRVRSSRNGLPSASVVMHRVQSILGAVPNRERED